MATKYDPELLQTFADRLYRRAAWVLGWYALLGFLAGWLGDAIVFSRLVLGSSSAEHAGPAVWLLPLVGILLGWACGSGKAFQLKLDAQRTLCQLQIERNTRPVASAKVESAA
jgi:hypothetical protein